MGVFLITLRVHCMQTDLYYPHPFVQDVLWGTLHKVVEPVLTRWPGSMLRKKALAHTMEHIHYEDENTRYLDIGPVNKVSMLRSLLQLLRPKKLVTSMVLDIFLFILLLRNCGVQL